MRGGCDVYAKSGAVCVAVCLATWGLERQLRPLIQDRALRSAGAFAVLQIIAIISIAVYLLTRRGYSRVMESIYEQLRPAIRERVLALAFAGESWSTVVPKRGPARQVLEEILAHTLAEVKESGRVRVAEFAVDHGFAAQWVKAAASQNTCERKRAITLLGLVSPIAGVAVILAALDDKHAGVRTEAARALLVAGELSYVDRVFRGVLPESLLVRALVTSDLKRHMQYLMTDTIPNILSEGTRLETGRCLEMMVSWRRALVSFDIEPWLQGDGDQFIRPLVLTMLPYVPLIDSIGDHLLAALRNADLDVRCAAARSSGLLKVERLMPALAATLNQNRRFAIAAATAIAQMGTAGERCLEKIVSGPDRVAAAVAMEALEHLTLGLR